MNAFPLFKIPILDPGAKPLEPFGERLECSEGGSTGRQTNRSCRLEFGPAVRSAPNQDRWSPGFIGFFAEKARQNNAALLRPRAPYDLYTARVPASSPRRRSASFTARSAPSRICRAVSSV